MKKFTVYFQNSTESYACDVIPDEIVKRLGKKKGFYRSKIDQKRVQIVYENGTISCTDGTF